MTPEEVRKAQQKARKSEEEAMNETRPQIIRNLRLERLESHQQTLYSALSHEGGWTAGQIRNRLQLIWQVISEKRGEIQHRESMRVGWWTLWIAVAAVVVPGFLALILHSVSSRPRPSKTDLERSPPSLQTPATTNVLSEQDSSSTTATPSPEQSATVQSLSDTPSP